jgi:hypothetical protein
MLQCHEHGWHEQQNQTSTHGRSILSRQGTRVRKVSQKVKHSPSLRSTWTGTDRALAVSRTATARPCQVTVSADGEQIFEIEVPIPEERGEVSRDIDLPE